MIKMIVTDLDGTLLNEKSKVSRYTRKQLKRYKDEGSIITIATGRIYSMAVDALKNLKYVDYIITDNGACVYDIKEKKYIYSNYISRDIVKNIYNMFNDRFKYINFCDKNYVFKYTEEKCDNFKRLKLINSYKKLESKAKDITHITIKTKVNDEIFDVAKEIRENYPTLEPIIMQDSFENDKWLDISVKNCNKFNTINWLINRKNIKSDEIIVFGDGLNDIDMVANFPNGVAMNNALDEVKMNTKYITKYSNKQNGVVLFLEDYFKKNLKN